VTPDEAVTALVVRLLEECGVPYMVAGSIASSHHGRPRMTQDVHIVIDPDAASLARLVSGLEAAGLYVDALRAQEALTHHRQFNAIDPSSGMKIDFIVRKDRPFSREELARARPGRLDAGTIVRLASPEDTIVAKLEWALRSGGSERQLADAAGIVEAQGAALDRGYIERWAAVLGVTDLWRQVLAARP
jgi:hypothetical protein